MYRTDITRRTTAAATRHMPAGVRLRARAYFAAGKCQRGQRQARRVERLHRKRHRRRAPLGAVRGGE